MMKFDRSRFGLAIVAGVISAGVYAVVVAFANLVLEQHWPLMAWAALLIMGLTVAGALALQYETQRRLDAMLAKWDGLETATGLCEFEEEMKSSDEHPREQLHTIKFSFDFMGNGGSKWTREEPKMRQMLEEVGNAHNEARMLLLRPDSEVCMNASQDRHKNPSTLPLKIIRSLQVLDGLKHDFPHLHFKLYDHTPYFRLTFVDGRAAIVGHYKQYRDDSEYSPLMVWEAVHGGGWSFYWAFKKYFDAEWAQGKTIDTEGLNTLARRFENNGD